MELCPMSAAATVETTDTPSTYEEHENAIRRASANPDELKVARQKFADAFPLVPSLWMEWLSDEISLAKSAEDRAYVASVLFPRALNDYISVDVTVLLIQFQRNRLAVHDIDLDEFRNCFKTFIRPGASGLDYSRGVLVWRAYRNALQSANVSVDEQIDVLSRQLVLPLLGNEEEANQELYSRAMAHAKDSIADAGELMDTIRSFEAKILQAGSVSTEYSGIRSEDLLSRFEAYCSSEEQREASAACTIWERYVGECFLHPPVWLKYGQYCKRHSAVLRRRKLGWGGETVDINAEIHVLRRAVKNVPWSMPLWSALISALDRADEGHDRIQCFAKVVSETSPNVMQSQDTYGVEQLARQIIIYAYRLLGSGFPEADCRRFIDIALSYNITGGRSWAKVKCTVATLDPDVSIRLQSMEDVIASRPYEALWWIVYADLCEDPASRRAIFQRALKEITMAEDVDLLSNLWLVREIRNEFELTSAAYRDVYDDMTEKIDARRRQVLIPEQTKESSPGKISHKRANPVPLKPPRKKSRIPEVQTKHATIASEKDGSKRRVKKSQEESEVVEKATRIVKPCGSSSPDNEANPEPRPNHDVSYDEKVVYVNNLDFKVTEDEIFKTFSAVGHVQDVRLPRRVDGASKGFAYVEFEDDTSVDAALALDKMKISGREIWVRRSKPPKAKLKSGSPGRPHAKRGQNMLQPSASKKASNEGTTLHGLNSASKSRPQAGRNFRLHLDSSTGQDTEMTTGDDDGRGSEQYDRVNGQNKPSPRLRQQDFRAMLGFK